MNDTALNPQRTALLLLDFQNGVLPSVAAAEGLVERVGQGLKIARHVGLYVCHVRVAFTAEERSAIPATNKMFSRIAATDFLSAHSPAMESPVGLVPREAERMYTKTRVGAFSTTSLHQDLATAGIDTLILAGIHTSGVVLSTVRAAADLDYRLFVIEDLCADPNAEVHDCLMQKVFPAQAEIVGLSALAGMLR